MPSYKTHVSINLALGLPLALAALKYSVKLTPDEVAYFSGAYLYGTLFLHPDLDLAHNIRLFSLKGLLTLPFRPLSYFTRHRGISHVPLFGTALRLLWLYSFLLLIFSLMEWSYPSREILDDPKVWFAIFGLGAADLFHIFLDKIFA